MSKPRKLKAWFTYAGSRDWFHCILVLENGWAPFSHICSHPNFAAGDLFFGRPERMSAFKQMGIELDIQGTVPDVEVPKEVLERNQGDGWEAMSEEYCAITRAEGRGE